MKLLLTVTIFIILLLTSSCKADTFEMYKYSVREMVQNPKQRQFKESDKDLDNMRGCQYLQELGWWQMRNDKRWGISWKRWNVWKDGAIESHRTFGLDSSGIVSIKILSNNSIYPIFIGPWHFSPSIQKFIRFFAYYPKEGGDIKYQYESQTPENKLIPEKKFSLSKIAKIAPDRFGLCVVKWTAKYGYNSIAEVKYNGFFNKIFRLNPIPTGKIIEVKE